MEDSAVAAAVDVVAAEEEVAAGVTAAVLNVDRVVTSRGNAPTLVKVEEVVAVDASNVVKKDTCLVNVPTLAMAAEEVVAVDVLSVDRKVTCRENARTPAKAAEEEVVVDVSNADKKATCPENARMVVEVVEDSGMSYLQCWS